MAGPGVSVLSGWGRSGCRPSILIAVRNRPGPDSRCGSVRAVLAVSVFDAAGVWVAAGNSRSSPPCPNDVTSGAGSPGRF